MPNNDIVPNYFMSLKLKLDKENNTKNQNYNSIFKHYSVLYWCPAVLHLFLLPAVHWVSEILGKFIELAAKMDALSI